jgi:signal transduction histidine kinase/CheY-like chemotaxis protein
MNTRTTWGVVVIALGVCALAAVVFAARRTLAERPVPVGPIRAGYVHDPPYMYAGPDGDAKGLSVDVVREAARRAGISLEWHKADPAHDADSALREGVVDLWPALTVLPHRRKEFFFTEPWLRTDVYVVSRSDTGRPDANFTGRIGRTPLPVIDYLIQGYAPRARLVEMADGEALARALCRGELDAALLAAGDFASARSNTAWGCQGQDLRPYALPQSTLQLAIGARQAARDAALALRSEIDAMASDGTIKTIVLPYSFYAASEVLAVYENLQSRSRARFLAYGIAGLTVSLAGALALSLALYRAQRSARRALVEREALEAKLRNAHRLEAVGQLAGGVAHDFNNLVTVILGNCELAHPLAANPDVATALSEIRRAGERAADLVRQLLAFSRKQVVVPRVLSLHDELVQLEPMLRRLVRESTTIRLDLGAGHDLVRMDRGQLSQVLLNLTVNARDAMPAGGTLTFSTSTRSAPVGGGAAVNLTVADTGVGMPPDIQARAFEPFFSTKALGQGTGLGLAIVYGVVTRAGGTVALRSEPGRGTSVEISLPAASGPAEPHALPTEPVRVPQPRTILVVEDQDEVRRLVVQVLKRAGYDVLEARSGAEGLDRLRAGAATIALVITDVVMPGLSGPAMVDAARAVGLRTPVLFMSGYSQEDLRAGDGTEARLLHKPFTPGALLDAVDRALSGAGLRGPAGTDPSSAPTR